MSAAPHSKVTVARTAGVSRVIENVGVPPLKILSPASGCETAWLILASYGGGMVQGDSVHLHLRCEPGAKLFLGTQASSRVYRHLDAQTATQRIHGGIESGALAVVFPDPLVLHNDSRFRQQQRWDIARDASLVLGDWFQCGRSDSGEQFAYTGWESEIALNVAGKLAVLDRFRSDPVTENPRLPGRFGTSNLLLNLYAIGPVAAQLADVLEPFTAFDELHKIPAGPTAPPFPPLLASLSRLENTEGFILRAVGHTREDFAPLAAALFAHLAAPLLLGFNPLARKY